MLFLNEKSQDNQQRLFWKIFRRASKWSPIFYSFSQFKVDKISFPKSAIFYAPKVNIYIFFLLHRLQASTFHASTPTKANQRKIPAPPQSLYQTQKRSTIVGSRRKNNRLVGHIFWGWHKIFWKGCFRKKSFSFLLFLVYEEYEKVPRWIWFPSTRHIYQVFSCSLHISCIDRNWWLFLNDA